MLFGKNRDSEIGLWLPNCTRCAHTILLTTANFRTLFFPNSTTDPPITYTNFHKLRVYSYAMLYSSNIKFLMEKEGTSLGLAHAVWNMFVCDQYSVLILAPITTSYST